MQKTFFFLAYSIACAALMSMFIMSSGPTRYLFSLLAVVIGVQFFKRYEEKGIRIGFIVLVLVLSLLFPVFYVMLALANGWYINPDYLKSINQQ